MYGIPTCGKITLAEYMVKHQGNGLRVATMRKCMRSALNNKLQRFLGKWRQAPVTRR